MFLDRERDQIKLKYDYKKYHKLSFRFIAKSYLKTSVRNSTKFIILVKTKLFDPKHNTFLKNFYHTNFYERLDKKRLGDEENHEIKLRCDSNTNLEDPFL